MGRACPARTERPREPGSGRHLTLDEGSPYLWGLGASQASSYRVPKTATIPGLPPACSRQGPPKPKQCADASPRGCPPTTLAARPTAASSFPWGRPAAAHPPSLGGPGPRDRAASSPKAGLTPMLPITRSSRPQGSTPPSGSYRASLTGRSCQEVGPPGLLPLREAQRGGPSPTRGCPRAVQSPPYRRGAPIRKAGSAGSRRASVLPCWGGDDLQNCPSVLSAGHSLGSQSPGAKTTRTSPQDEELQELVCCSPGGLQGPEVTGGFIPCAVTPLCPAQADPAGPAVRIDPLVVTMKPGDTYILESEHVLTATGPQVHKASGPCGVNRPWLATQPSGPECAL